MSSRIAGRNNILQEAKEGRGEDCKGPCEQGKEINQVMDRFVDEGETWEGKKGM